MGANTRILDFFSGRQCDDEGRFLRDLQSWPDTRLESVHDFIQWMFPLTEPSPVNPDAPILDGETIAAIRASPGLQEALRSSWVRMLDFYGFEYSGERVQRSASFEKKSANWLHPNNHNHLRITRILKCLRLLGLEEEARVFFDCLTEVRALEGGITDRTFEFWRRAAQREQ